MSINILGITPAGSAPTAPQEKIIVPVVQEGSIPASAASDPVIELLKQLLPVDNPIGTLLERFRQAAAFSTPAASEEQSFAEVIELLRNLPVDLKTVTADQLRKAIDRLGLRYEPMLQQAFTQRTPPVGPQLTAQNLKAALLQFLATQPPPTAGSPPVPNTPTATHTPETRLRQEVLHTLAKYAQQNLETFLVKQLEAQARTVTTVDTEQASSDTTRPAAVPSGLPQTAQVLTKILTVLDGYDVPQLKSALIQMLKAASSNTEKPVLGEPKQEGLPAREQALTMDDLKQALSKLNLPALQDLMHEVLADSRPKLNPGVTQRFTASSVDEQQSPSVAPQESEAEQPLMQDAKPGMVRADQSRARHTMEAVQPQPVTKVPLDNDVSSPSPALPVSSGTVREQAHELLTAIERTQVLNSINGERGQPVTFQIPILLDSQTSTAQFYIEQRPDESRVAAPEDRHYSIVALLELSGLGNLRIDLALYRKNLSVKVTVERSDAEVFANQLLPDLGQALKDRGFALEFLKCERKIQGGTGATELRDRTLPQNVVNLRV